MNTNQNVSFGSGVGPSGTEVESAMFRPEVMPPERSDLRGKLDDLKSRSLSRLDDVRRVMSDRTSVIKSNMRHSMTTAKSSMRDGVSTGMTKMQSSMRENPAKWAGIAAGSGFALGMLGRLIHWRSHQHRHAPQLVVIETSC
jgi:ElaB/YqjD/DUF883 family membrane-anchored ribosome-binding protein